MKIHIAISTGQLVVGSIVASVFSRNMGFSTMPVVYDQVGSCNNVLSLLLSVYLSGPQPMMVGPGQPRGHSPQRLCFAVRRSGILNLLPPPLPPALFRQ
jgi:hypothetical protein